MSKETSPHIPRDQFISVKRDVSIHESKHTYNTFLLQYLVLSQQLVINVKRDPIHIKRDVSARVKRDLQIHVLRVFAVCFGTARRDVSILRLTVVRQKRPIHVKRDLYRSKETYTCQQRPNKVKRDLYRSKETMTDQTRPTQVKTDIYRSKETYTCQQRPVQVKRDHNVSAFGRHRHSSNKN